MPGEQLERAIELIKDGQKESARAMLTQIVQDEPGNAAAWLWLAETMPSDTERIAVLEACLRQNPQSQMVQRGLERLRARQLPASRLPPMVASVAPISPAGPAESAFAEPAQEETQIRPEQAWQPHQATPEPPTQPLPATRAVDDLDTLRQTLIGQSKPARRGRAPVKPVPVAIEATAYDQDQSLTEPAAPTPGKAEPRRTPPARRRRSSCAQWLVLVVLGLLAAGVVSVTGYVLRDQLRAWLGYGGPAASSTNNGNTSLTPGGVNLNAQTLTPPVPTSTFTPTPTITPIPTPTATVAFTFQYGAISPENGAQVVQVGEFSAIPARCVAISSDNRLLAAGMDDSTVMVWNLTSGAILQTFQGPTLPVNAADFSPDSRLLVAGSEDGSLHVWDVYAGTLLYTLPGQSGAVKSVAFSPDGNTIASGTQGGNIVIWRLGVSIPERVMPAGGAVLSLDLSPDGRLLAAGLLTGVIQVWNTADGSLLKTLPGTGSAANSVAFAPSGHRLAVGSQDMSVKLWDVDGGKVLYTVGTHTEPVVSVCFSPDGRVLASSSQGQTIKLWDVAGRREIASLRHARNMPGIAFSPDGRVLAAALSPTNPQSREGGVALWGILFNPEATPAAEAITLNTLQMGRWFSGARMAAAHVAHQVAPVSGGRILIIGGGVADDPDSFTNKTELYNPASNSSTFTGGLNVSRGLFSATLLTDGRVLVVGGYNPVQGYLASAELYDPVSGAWSLTNPLFNHGVGHTATLLTDGRVLVAGGCMGDGPSGRSNRAELFDPPTNSWTETNVMSQPRCNPSAMRLTDGRVLAAGGEDGQNILSSAEVFDPIAGRWSNTGEMITARSQAVALRLADGRVMVTGGLSGEVDGAEPISGAEIYNPDLGKWVQAARMTYARYAHTADLLPGGLVLVVGGLEGTQMTPDQFLTSVEVYDPVADAWQPIASLTTPRAFHTTMLTPDGHIFVMGGMSSLGSFLASTEILSENNPANEPTPTETLEGTLQPGITLGIEITTTPTSTLSSAATPTPTGTPPVEVTPTPTITAPIEATPTPTSSSGEGAAFIPPDDVRQNRQVGAGLMGNQSMPKIALSDSESLPDQAKTRPYGQGNARTL